jgi:phosphopantetheinyl transferase (holo-ACP synthase)
MSQWSDAEGAISAALGIDVVLGGHLAGAAERAGVSVATPFRPPHPHLSLTHAGHVVVAAAVAAADRPRVAGLGVDYEPADRWVGERAARLFLDEVECAYVAARPEGQRSLARLMLWTVKEAAYKATPDNAGHTVAAYHVAGASREGVTHFREGLSYRHVVVPFAAGILAVAILDELEAITVGNRRLLPQVRRGRRAAST